MRLRRQGHQGFLPQGFFLFLDVIVVVNQVLLVSLNIDSFGDIFFDEMFGDYFGLRVLFQFVADV